jgi:D-glucuronyl C5-epimerase C-terminus/F5/8 type C domain
MREFYVWIIVVIGLNACSGAAIPPASPVAPTPQAVRTINDIRIIIKPDDLPGECLPYSRTYAVQSDPEEFSTRPIILTDDDVIQFETSDGEWVTDVRRIAVLAENALRAWCEEGDVKALQLAINHANWLVDNATLQNGIATWIIDEERASMFVPAGWTGAIFDGRGMIVLLQVYALTHDPKYRDMAQRVARAFSTPVSEGGLVRSQGDGKGVFFEEAAHPDAPPGQILNGHMLAVEMLAYYADYSGDEQAARMVEEGILGIRSRLDDYDASTIASYSIGPIRWGSARTHYAHEIHVHELFWIYERTGDPIFLDWCLRWQRYMWSALPASLYYDEVSEDNFRFEIVDDKRHMDVPSSAHSLILDLYEPVTAHSFGYSMIGPYPTDFTIDASLDGTTWETMLKVTDYDKQHGSFFLNDVKARYIRMTLDKMADYEDIYYYGYQNGFYRNRLMLGVLRIDDADYWEKPILLLTNGRLVTARTQLLQDGNAETSVAVPSNAVLYGDLREPGQIATIIFDAKDDSGQRNIWLETSSDLTTWDSLIRDTGTLTTDFPGTITIPGAEADYQYFRLHLDGDEPLTLTDVTFE